MPLDSILSVVITIFVVIIITMIVVVPICILYWWLSNKRIKRLAKEYLESDDYKKDLKELEGGVNYGIQKERTEDRRATNLARVGTGATNPTRTNIGFGGIAKGDSNIKAVSRTSNPSIDRNKRRVTLH